MAHCRNINPRFFRNEVLSEMSPDLRLLFIGLWTLADRCGRLEDRPKRIQVEIFPYGISADVDSLLEVLDTKEFIFRYSLNGENYIQIPKWFSYQHPHPHEQKSMIPPIPCDLADFKQCHYIARQSRDIGVPCQAVPSVPSVPSGIPPVVFSKPENTTSPLAENAKGEFNLSPSNGGGSKAKKEPKPKKPRVHRIDDPGNPGWELWKYVGWCKLFSSDPKRDRSSGAKELFGRFVQTEDDLAWLMETHGSSNRAGQYEPGFNVWIKAALEARAIGMGSKVFAGLALNREETSESTDKRKRKAAELGCKACGGSGHVFVKQVDGPIGMLNCHCIFVDGADATKQRALVETEMALSPTGATA